MSELIHIDNVGGFLEKLKTRLNVTGNAPMGVCRAWVNFDGTTTPITIRASMNVASITDNGTGDYTINFTAPLPDANYSVIGQSVRGYTVIKAGVYIKMVDGSITTPAKYDAQGIRIVTADPGNDVGVDPTYISLAIFR